MTLGQHLAMYGIQFSTTANGSLTGPTQDTFPNAAHAVFTSSSDSMPIFVSPTAQNPTAAPIPDCTSQPQRINQDYHGNFNSQKPPPTSGDGVLDQKLKYVKISDDDMPEFCVICGDRVTGKHYGTPSCDGCKGFFRRTIRKAHEYVCRFDQRCIIDKDKRNTCRYCRYQKCLASGMKPESVQNERDSIKPKKIQVKSEDQPTIDSLVSMLLKAEAMCVQLRRTVIQSNTTSEPGNDASQEQSRLATVNDISESIRQQLLLLVEWSKLIPVFTELELNDQMALLRGYAAQHLMMTLTRRSLPYKDVLILSNEACILREHFSRLPNMTIQTQPMNEAILVNADVISRILDELVEPMRTLDMDDTEFAYFKAILFFNPYVPALTQRGQIDGIRQTLITGCQRYIEDNTSSKPRRMANILLLSSPLQGVAQLFVETLQVASQYGVVSLDNLLHEMMLTGNDAAELLSKFTRPSLHVPVLTAMEAINERYHIADFSTSPPPNVGMSPAPTPPRQLQTNYHQGSNQNSNMENEDYRSNQGYPAMEH